MDFILKKNVIICKNLKKLYTGNKNNCLSLQRHSEEFAERTTTFMAFGSFRASTKTSHHPSVMALFFQVYWEP